MSEPFGTEHDRAIAADPHVSTIAALSVANGIALTLAAERPPIDARRRRELIELLRGHGRFFQGSAIETGNEFQGKLSQALDGIADGIELAPKLK